VLVAEEAHLGAGIPAVVVEAPTDDPARDEDRATTLVLSGRADAVATLSVATLATAEPEGSR
jgi:hypothetical protein